MAGVIVVLLLGSVLVASRLSGLGNSSGSGNNSAGGTPVAVGSPSPAPTPRPAGSVASPVAGSPVIGSPTATVTVQVGQLRSAKDVAEAYVQVWSAGNYDQLYDLISSNAQTAISRTDFVTRYTNIGIEAGITKLDAKVSGGKADDTLFPIRVAIESARVGAFTDENQLPVVKEGNDYRVDWSPSLIFSGLGDGYVRWTPDVPQRGRILDRKGRPLAEQGNVSRIGVVPGKIENEADLLAKLSSLLNMPQEQIKARYANGQPDWFMPIKDLPDNLDQALVDQINGIKGVIMQKWPARVYPAGPVAAQVVGYMSQITAEELPELSKRGYAAGDMIGRTGVEAWGEQYLAGKRGGTLALLARDDSTIRVLGQVQSEPANDIVLTIDLDVQTATDAALGDQTGSAVVMDPNNGELLAMVSHPTYDPNWFILGVTDQQWAQLNDPQRQPLVNRAVQAGYPTGSTFKVVTAAAGMAYLGLQENTVLSCPGEFTLEGTNAVWRDWVPGGQGNLTLRNAIVRSCNTVFYKMGADLDTKDESLLPTMARGFGFGSPTGIPELVEIAGIVPDPQWKQANVGDYWARGDAVNFAIGQGYFVASPLQLADAYGAIANGGTLWTPHLTLDIVRLDGSIVQEGQVKERGKLPISPEQIGVLQRAMYDVINAENGTATAAFQGIQYDVSGKTGTEETGNTQQATNAWFGAFTPSNSPKIVVVTMVEGGKAGSTAAAPVARQIIDAYYAAYPQ